MDISVDICIDGYRYIAPILLIFFTASAWARTTTASRSADEPGRPLPTSGVNIRTYVYIAPTLPIFFVTCFSSYSECMGKNNNRVSICAFCSRMKRGVLYRVAREHKYNVLAMAHHLDDCAESFLMSALHNGDSYYYYYYCCCCCCCYSSYCYYYYY